VVITGGSGFIKGGGKNWEKKIRPLVLRGSGRNKIKKVPPPNKKEGALGNYKKGRSALGVQGVVMLKVRGWRGMSGQRGGGGAILVSGSVY